MASSYSFDIVSEANLPEVENAVNQTIKEITQRYDFKGSKTEIKLEEDILISTEDEFRLNAVIEILKVKLIKRGVSVKNLDFSKVESAKLGTVRQTVTIVNGISKEKAKDIINDIKGSKLKVQSQIMDVVLRISAKDKDELQKVMALTRGKDYGIDLQFTNYR
ncbi:MAG TPA: YajQ family cyclic di-GMP-binding protein [Clostridiaceae bacterium]